MVPVEMVATPAGFALAGVGAFLPGTLDCGSAFSAAPCGAQTASVQNRIQEGGVNGIMMDLVQLTCQGHNFARYHKFFMGKGE